MASTSSTLSGLQPAYMPKVPVGQAALFAHLLEEARRHGSTQDRQQDTHGRARRVRRRQALAPDDDVRLGDVASAGDVLVVVRNRAWGSRSTRPGRGRTAPIPRRSIQGGLHALAHGFVVDVTCGGHNEGRGAVVSLVVLPHVGTLDLADRLGRATHRAPDRTVAMDSQLEGIVNRIGRRILPHRQFIQDDAAFHRKVILIQAGVSDHVGQRLDRHVEVRVTHARPVCRMLARGFCVRLAANAIESDSDIERRTLVRALEQKMLQEVRRPGRTRPLVARAHGHPQRDSRASQLPGSCVQCGCRRPR